MDLKLDDDNSRLEMGSTGQNQIIELFSLGARRSSSGYFQVKYADHPKIHLLMILSKVQPFSFFCLMLSEAWSRQQLTIETQKGDKRNLEPCGLQNQEADSKFQILHLFKWRGISRLAAR